jgi:hypothetical protein
MASLQLIGFRNYDQSGRVELEGDEAEQMNKLFRPTPERLKQMQRSEEACVLAALQCQSILVD